MQRYQTSGWLGIVPLEVVDSFAEQLEVTQTHSQIEPRMDAAFLVA